MSNLVAFDPFHELDRVRREMGRIFEDSISRIPSLESSGNYRVGFVPPVDIYATNDEIVVFVNLPGVNINDVEVTATKDTLSISGEIKPAQLPDGATCIRQERLNGQFKRMFQLPVAIQSDKVSASFKDGILGIRLPKAEELISRPVKIEVK
ncbi:MAG: Hsp20/alpha crystallin family protein [Firmicutes bacterium]|nr:Hsp20/alpha crystallin family protein [Bacillota bacterium]